MSYDIWFLLEKLVLSFKGGVQKQIDTPKLLL